MSQAGVISIADSGGATSFVEDTGAAAPAAGVINIVGGAGITTSGAGNTVTITASDSAFTWHDQIADLNPLVKENGYFADKAAGRIALTLPTGATQGDYIKVVGFGTNGWQLNAGAGQTIIGGTMSTTVAGSVSSTNQYDTIEVICSPTTTTWLAVVRNGNLTYA